MGTKTAGIIETINDMINFGRERDVLHLYAEDESYNGRTIRIKGKEHINFGSCSYLGLDVDERIKEGAIEAIRKYGIHCSSSRTYISSTPHAEYERLMRELFGAPIILTTTTSLGHHAVIPVVVEEGSAIILDQQVHASIQDAALKMVSKGVHVTKIRHSSMEELEAQIIELIVKHDKVWYMIDGIYSMYGDYPPLKKIVELMNKYKQFHLYVDDAHGMSIAGKHGRGAVLSQIGLHKKMILATSLNKAFAVGGGGVFVFPDEELCKKVMNCGGPLIFSGPIANATIGAGIASAKIHLSDEIIHRQEQLKEKLHYCHELLLKYNLPVVSNRDAPINFVGCGLTKVGVNMVKRMMNDGFYVNLAMFPAVPDRCTGVRFTITLHHTKEDIDNLVGKLAYHFPKALQEEGRTFADLQLAFVKVATFKEFPMETEVKPANDDYILQHETTIEKIDKDMWNKLIGSKGVNDWNQMKFFEQSFSGHELPEHNWNFHYYIVRDKENTPVLATYFTTTLAKDDMFSPAAVSKQLEYERKDNPYYLTSTTFTMGCLLSIGEHIYIDRTRADWKKAMMILLDEVWKEQDRQKATVLSLRDFDPNDQEMHNFFLDQSFIKMEIPDGHIIDNLGWNNVEDFLDQMNSDKRKYMRKRVLEFENRYEISLIDKASENELDHYYQLYKNVSDKNHEIVVFDLNKKFFEYVIKHPQWEFLELKLKPEYDNRPERKAVGIVISYRTDENYCGLIAGMDYDFAEENGVYPQTMWQTIKRASELKLKTINLGYTASQNKRKFGAKILKNVAYVQMRDSFNAQLISTIANKELVGIKK